MTTKYQRPAGAYTGASALANRTKYQDDATATPKRAISSAKVDGDLNYLIDGLNEIDEARGTAASIAERLNVAFNTDGTLKASATATIDEFVVHLAAGALARVDNSTLTLAGGNFTGIYTPNRRVQITTGGVALVGDVVASTFANGQTTVTCVDLYAPDGTLGIISATPTQVAYGPLTTGPRGNQMRRTDSLNFPATDASYTLTTNGGEMVIARNGTPVARVNQTGISGLAPASVALVNMAEDAMLKLVPSGVMVPYAGVTQPAGWLFCYGQLVSRTTYASLFAALGTTYGVGDGTTTFALPDMRGRTAFGLDNMGGTDAARLSSANTLGQGGGGEKKNTTTDAHILTTAEMPAHYHVQGMYVQTAVAGSMRYGLEDTGQNAGYYDSGGNGSGTTGAKTSTVGGNGGHTHGITNLDVMPPYLLTNYIIKV
jgi:microcystin-dependent protein